MEFTIKFHVLGDSIKSPPTRSERTGQPVTTEELLKAATKAAAAVK